MADPAELEDLFGHDDEEENCYNVISKSGRPASSGVLAFHNGTEEAMYHFVKARSKSGDPAGILSAIDEFCYSQHWMMHVGDKKLPLLERSIQSARELRLPHERLCVVELGAYCGYSTIYFGSLMHKERGDHVYSVEINPKCVAWTQRMVQWAGLSDVVTVIEGAASASDQWKDRLHKPSIDLLFIDHDKAQYLKDLVSLETAALVTTGTVVVADNVLSFNVPLSDYLDHVRDPTGRYASSELHTGLIEYAAGKGDTVDPIASPQLVDGVEISVHR